MIENIINFFTVFWQLVLEMSPWLLLGFLMSGILKVFVPASFLQTHLGEPNFLSVVKASLLGVPLPLCSCGVIPVTCSLYKNGASKGAVSSFLISTPQTGVDSIFATYAMLGLPFAILRPIIALFSGFVGGGLANVVFKDEKKQNYSFEQEETNYGTFTQKWKEVFRYGFVSMVQDLSKWILIGLVLASLVSILIPEGYFSESMANTWKEFLIIILISLPLYVCATGSIPLAMVFAMKGISPGAILVFLMLGPATNIATITVLSKVIGKKFVLVYLFSIVLCSIGFGILINSYSSIEWFSFSEMNHHSAGMYGIVNIISGVVLSLLMVYSFLKSIKINKKVNVMNSSSTVIQVDGMTCNHCKSSVEKNVAKIKGITSVEVDLNSKTVAIQGEEYSKEEVENCINDLGYEVKK
ncbi:MAG: permease [Flavobacteriales bacterium]|nr:permease [Flavobacteriales bacterium]